MNNAIRINLLALAACALAASGCSGGVVATPTAQSATSSPVGVPGRVLFIGNSLTYVNDLPAIVATLAAANGQPALTTKTVAFADVGLPDH